MILGICEEPSILNVMRLVVLLIKILRVAVPIILIIVMMLRFASAMTKHDDAAVTKAMKSVVPNIIAAVLIFLVPSFVDIVVKISMPNSDYTKCISDITIEKVNQAYNSKMDKLISEVESSLEYSDYTSAYAYLQNIKDAEKKQEYVTKLDTIKKLIDAQHQTTPSTPSGGSEYAKVNYSNFKWTTYKQKTGPLLEYYDNPVTYFVYGPENVSDLNGVSLPLIVWLHGRGEIGTSGGILGSGLFKVVNDWSKYNLDPIPAIIVAPQTPEQGWSNSRNINTIKALISYAKDKYKINSNDITLMGHSMGGNGVITVSRQMKDTYSALVIMSGGSNTKVGNDADYFSKIKMRGFAENNDYKYFFTSAQRENDFVLYNGTSHGGIPQKAMTEDTNKDGISDLIYWLYSDKAKIKQSSQSESQGGSSGSSSSSGSGSSSGSSSPAPTAKPITKSVDINAVNSALAATVKSHGLYTRGAVVSVATTLVSKLDSYNYYIPYQLGGMYHRGNAWGLNPDWGTVIEHNGKMVLSGLDCRNFVIWTFKQAGLSLKRGLMYDTEAMITKRGDNKYSDISMGKPGDTIDAPGHLMLIVKNNGSSYTVAESNGVGRVRIFDWTYDKLKADGYNVYNMDGIYNNTAALCPMVAADRPYSGSCHIPKSEFPAYYGF